MNHRIVVPHDFSPLADNALDWAARLVRQHGGSVVLLHVIPLLVPAAAPAPAFPTPTPAEMDALRRQLLAAAGSREVAAEAIVLLAPDVGAEILSLAKAVQADLIAMGTHGRGGVKRAMLGSVADYVVRHAECPVVTLRGKAPAAPH
jgi:nucleotide-binding universal stress UspA family protein